MKHSTLIFAILLLVGLKFAFPQSNCSEQLRQAERRFDEGLLDDIPQMIRQCIASGFTKEERVNAYKLLIQTYLFSDQKQKADEEMLRFLRSFPEYRVVSTDPKEFINLYGTYRTDPIMRIEACVGTSYSLPWVKEFYGIEDLNNKKASYLSTFGVIAEVNYIDRLFGDFDGSFGISFGLSRIGYFNEAFDFTTINGTLNSYYVGVPLALRYEKTLLGIRTFVKGGFEPSYLLASSISFQREFTGGKDPTTGTESIIEYQKKFDIKPLLSVGVNIRIKNAQFMVTSGIKFGTIMPTDATKRYSNETLFQKYYFIADDFLVHQSFVSLSYIFSVYNPKKIQ